MSRILLWSTLASYVIRSDSLPYQYRKRKKQTLKIRSVRSINEFKCLESVWNRILHSNGGCHIFQTFEWNYSWWLNFGADFNLYILVVENEKEVTGICPLMYSERCLGLIKWRKFEFIGKRVSNYHDIILGEKGEGDETLNLLIRYLHNSMTGLDYVILRLFPEESISLRLLKGVLKHSDMPYKMIEDDSSHLVKIDGAWQTYLRIDVPRKFRYEIRRQIRRLEEKGRLSVQECKDDEALQEALTELFKMKIAHRKSKGEKRTYFEDAVFQKFDREAGRLLLKKKWLFTHIIKFDDHVIGVNFDFIFNDRIYCHEIAYDIGFDRRYSPGRILQHFELEKSFSLKAKEFDFAWGNAFYKRNWCNYERKTYKIYLFKKNLYVQNYYIENFKPFLKRLYKSYLTPAARQNIKTFLRLSP